MVKFQAWCETLKHNQMNYYDPPQPQPQCTAENCQDGYVYTYEDGELHKDYCTRCEGSCIEPESEIDEDGIYEQMAGK